MTNLMQRRWEMMMQKSIAPAPIGTQVEFVPGIDWLKSQGGYYNSQYRATSFGMIPVSGFSTVKVQCPFTSSTYAAWGTTSSSAGYYVRMLDANGNGLSSVSLWGSNADNNTISLVTGTAYIIVGFQRGTTSACYADDFTLVRPLNINGFTYNTKFKSQEKQTEWNYEWDYTMGLLSTYSWVKTTSGTASESGGKTKAVELRSASSSYVSMANSSAFNKSKGVIECDFKCGGFGSSGAQNFRLCFSNGTNGIQIFIPNGRGLSLMNTNDFQNAPILATINANQRYVLKLILNNGVGEVWLDGIQVAQNVDITAIQYSTSTRIMSQNQANNITYIYSVKMKLGRT